MPKPHIRPKSTEKENKKSLMVEAQHGYFKKSFQGDSNVLTELEPVPYKITTLAFSLLLDVSCHFQNLITLIAWTFSRGAL